MRLLKQSTAYSLTVFMADSSDHITGKTGLTLTITASKAGAAFGSISPTVTELATGWYKLALTTSHTDTLGDLALHVTGTGADPSDLVMQVTANILGDTLPANVTQFGGSNGTFAAGRPDVNATHLAGTSQTGRDIGASVLLSPGTGTGQVSLTSGAVTVGTNNDKSGYTATVSDKTGFSLTSAYDAAKTAAQAGNAMTLTSGERTAIANEVEAQIIDDTDTEKVLEAITNKIAAANPDLSGLTLSAIAVAVRSELTAELARIDAPVSDVQDGVDTLTSRLTEPRAAALDYLDVPASSRLADADYVAPPSATDTAEAVRAELATELARVDEAVSSRLASDGYTAPLDAAGVRTAVGLATANLDTQLGAIDTAATAAKDAAEAIPVGVDGVEANLKAVNDVPLTGTGTGSDPWGPA